MDFFQNFWVPLDYSLSTPYLVVFILFELLIILTTIFFYYRVRYRVKKSILGPANDAELKFQVIVLESLRTSFIGIILITSSNLISHISRFFDSSCDLKNQEIYHNCYLFIGQEDVIQLFGFIFFLVGLSNLFQELTRNSEDDVIKFRVFPITIIIVLFTIIFGIINPDENLADLTNEIYIAFSSFILLLIYLFYGILTSWRKGPNNIINQTRKKLIVLLFTFFVASLFSIYFFFIPQVNYYPTRTINVELLIFAFDIQCIVNLCILLVIVFLPKSILKFFGIDEQQFLKYADFRFDRPSEISFNIITFDESEFTRLTRKFLLIYDKYEISICNNILLNYEGQVIAASNIYEDTLKVLYLPNSDIMYFVSRTSRIANNYTKSINSSYSLSFRYDYNLETVVSDSYTFSSRNYKYALLTIAPSFWNNFRKLIIINYTYDMSDVIENFFIEFSEYINEILYQKRIMQIVLRFPIQEEEIQPIPKISSLVKIPDPKFLVIL